MEKYDFILMYEHKVRELDNLCLLKYELDKRGYRTKILYENDWGLLQTRTVAYQTKVLIIGYCYTSSSIRDYASYRIRFDKVVNLQWEQIITNDQENNNKSFRNLSGLAKEIVHISWGKKNYLRLVEKAGVAPRNVKITGNLTMDFTRPEFREFYLSREQICSRYGLPNGKKLCLFIAGFKYIEAPEEVREANIRRFGEGRRRYLEVADKEQLTILQWFATFLETRQDYVIIYRPHPGDISPRTEKLAERFPNLVVISELSVKQWIAVCDVVCAWNSTAIFEAFFAGRNPFFLCPYPIPEDQSHPLFSRMNKIRDYEAFYCAMTQKAEKIGLTEEMVDPYYHVDRKTPSYIKICDELEKICEDPKYDWTKKQKREYWKLYSPKDRAAIWFMKFHVLHELYLWFLDNLPFSILKERKKWLEGREAEEKKIWREKNSIEYGDTQEIKEKIEKIREILEG